MAQNSIVVVGLPGSGKTTFLAALWHLVFGREMPIKMELHNIARGNQTHLNAIADRWLRAEVQDRTDVGGDQVVSLNLLDEKKHPVQITFPDVAGEVFSQMWEQRECEPDAAEMLRNGNVLLFINAPRIQAPHWVHELSQQVAALGGGVDEPDEEPVSWDPKLAPTQVQLVGLLTMLSEFPLDSGPRKLCVILSAWDKARGEGLVPAAFLEAKLPLLNQYLQTNSAQWEWQVYGVSAQGGDYDDKAAGKPGNVEAAELRKINNPAERIFLTLDGKTSSHDLTIPIGWLTT